MRRSILTVGVIGAVIVGAAGLAFGSGDVSSPQTIHAVFAGTESKVLDSSPSGPSLGDTQVVSGRILEGGKAVGRAAFDCTVHRGFVACEGAGKVSGGQVAFQGISWNNTNRHVWAITGGTQTYDNARGSIVIQDVSARRSKVTINVIP